MSREGGAVEGAVLGRSILGCGGGLLAAGAERDDGDSEVAERDDGDSEGV